RQRAAQIDQNQGFTPLDPATSAPLIKSRSEDELQNQEAHLGDIDHRHQAIAELRHLATSVEHDIDYAGQIRNQLHKSMIELSPNST
ncbi:hypothetical protein NK362_26235, partial [Salmonella enterica]